MKNLISLAKPYSEIRLPAQLLLISCCCILLTLCQTQQQGSSGKVSFLEVKNKTLIPEGIAVHPVTGRIYLSSVHQNKIVGVDDTGTVTDIIRSGQQGFMNGLGMKFSKDGKILWACTSDDMRHTALVAIDHVSGNIIKTYTNDSARFFNDLVILDDGKIFVTDTEIGALFFMQNDTLQLFLKDEQLHFANGITATSAGEILFVASGSYGLKKITTTTKAITSATNNKRIDYAIDGLVLQGNIVYAAIGWPQDSVMQHRIVRYHFDEQFNYKSADTLVIDQPWLQCPTTLALYKHQLFSLSTTNLGIYNRHDQQVSGIMDSLRSPVIAVFQLSKQ